MTVCLACPPVRPRRMAAKLAPTTTAYASYAESLEPGSRVNDVYANAGQTLKPLRSKQYELGIKSEHARWSATAALFRVERSAEYANAANVYVQDGESVIQGIEFGARAKLGARWHAGVDAMLLDAWYANGIDNNGNRVAGAPRFVLAGDLGYAVPGIRRSASTRNSPARRHYARRAGSTRPASSSSTQARAT